MKARVGAIAAKGTGIMFKVKGNVVGFDETDG
jgi:hypothetical protein